MTETKNQAFHRLATKRSENVVEALRIFGQLAAPSYDFTRDEALAYLVQIVEAAQAMETRFRESKQWGPEDEPEPNLEIIPDPNDGPDIFVMAPAVQRKSPTISEIIHEASTGQATELLASDIVLLQHAVIQNLKETLARIEANID